MKLNRLQIRLFFVLIILNCFSYSLHAQYAPNVWDVLRRQFTLNHEENRTEVKNQIRWLVAHPTYLKRLTQSEPYIFYIASEVRKRKMPGEIALIPIIESAYNPFAYSGVGAAGLWQIMPNTASGLGLKQDWWHDGRRSIGPSTDAALNYLEYLHKYFKGNWILAFAAYDSGEGTVSKRIRISGRNHKPNFWSLKLPKETQAYIPRLLALAAIIQNPQKYGVKLPDIPHAPYFEKVNVGSQIDLNQAAKFADISYKELIQLNPEYNRWTTAPNHPYTLLLPVEKIPSFYRRLADCPPDKRVSWKKHIVSNGESLSLIAQRHHTTVKLIKELNQLESNHVKIGQSLLIPNSIQTHFSSENNNASKPHQKSQASNISQKDFYKVLHIAQKKDTYESIAKHYQVSVSQIKNWNYIGPHMPLAPKQKLIIWQKNKHAVKQYIVDSGDSLSSIALKHHTTLSRLLKLNPSIKKHIIKPGQTILLG